MRAANLFLFLGTLGFINIYEEITSDDESNGKLGHSDVKRLQRKFGVKEKRSATLPHADKQAAAVAAAAIAAQSQNVNFAEYDEVRVVEHLKRPVYRVLADCNSADGTACNCLRLLCFGQAQCTAPATEVEGDTSQMPPLKPSDPRYIYYATGARLRAKRRSASFALEPSASSSDRDRLLRCRQATIDPFVLCECKLYARNPA
ncbi:hypothetical protein BOX15_Mlig019844g2 [Macrostomum lignano]|uniref:Uncharacterized protein n=1 Tax=Macrostomum lignano TaxID=282301 RepID=A0A267ECL5_9PLAT|nr:hypothetical protein BOX15_Mlig019844g1 [Macrostomum lignano]PAA78933.1 hypothetical protein BOX15_Mlig019844g3 [Macrostomum lignano]PAA93699.1 hypothetical protein BOX15_Mlig019844g2 [Macrostomum lignano]